ncbi:MAG: phosphatase PAP2 family protein [Bacteroidetes bacterium]|nr:phosphatase PAP2 family protein [Bacteroidota bacterium]
MIESFKHWDEKAFLRLNSFHSEALDPIVLLLTQTITWIPLYLLLLYLIYRIDPKNSIWVIGGVILTILLADQVSSGLMKPYFERLRPCHDPQWKGFMHLYGRCGGLYGFVSSHAANTFGLATFLTLTLSKKQKNICWLFLYAVAVSYTRIYLGVHYPLDVFFGALVGVLSAYFSWAVIVILKRKIVKKVIE